MLEITNGIEERKTKKIPNIKLYRHCDNVSIKIARKRVIWAQHNQPTHCSVSRGRVRRRFLFGRRMQMGESEGGGRKSKLKLISYSYSPHLHYGQDILGKAGEIPN